MALADQAGQAGYFDAAERFERRAEAAINRAVEKCLAELHPQSSVSLLPMPPGSSFLAQHQRYLTKAAEDELKRLVAHVRGHTLTYEVAAQGLGRITGYYDLLAEIDRQVRKAEETSRQ